MNFGVGCVFENWKPLFAPTHLLCIRGRKERFLFFLDQKPLDFAKTI